jgi:hypothetical protein
MNANISEPSDGSSYTVRGRQPGERSRPEELLRQKKIKALVQLGMNVIRDFYFRALGSLVVLRFPQLLSFSSVLSKPLSETVTSAETVSCPTVEHL